MSAFTHVISTADRIRLKQTFNQKGEIWTRIEYGNFNDYADGFWDEYKGVSIPND